MLSKLPALDVLWTCRAARARAWTLVMWAFPNKSLAGLGLAIVLTGTACATAGTEPMSRGEQGRLAGSIVLVDQVGNSLEIVDKGFRYEVEDLQDRHVSDV